MANAGAKELGAGKWRSQVLEVRKGRAWDLAFYSRIAPVYELWARLAESKARARLLERASVRDGEAILEVAVGTGAQLLSLARRNPSGRTVAVDLADGMLRRARRRIEQAGLRPVEIVPGDALALPFDEGSFDLVVNSYMLDLLPREDIPRALGEFRRVLRPGGRLMLSNMTKGEPLRHRLWDALYERGLSLTANCRGVLAAPALEELGFTRVEREYLAQMLVPSEIVSAWKPAADE